MALDLVARAISHRSDALSFAAARADRLGMDVALGRPAEGVQPLAVLGPVAGMVRARRQLADRPGDQRGRARSSARSSCAMGFLLCAGLGKEALGLGDADLMMMIGSFLGWQIVVVSVFVSVIPAAVFGVIRLIIYRDNSLPFGPSLAAGALITHAASGGPTSCNCSCFPGRPGR